MPFIRQTRDKRGVEHTYVMHTGRPGVGAQRPRVLYLFRSPGNLRVGRRVLDTEVREALEHTHPDLSFDWNALTREAVVSRSEPPPQRQTMKSARPRPASPPTVAPPAPPLPDDFSLLGRTLGAATAARIRGKFADVTQRIGRRARTPEERTSLLDRARALDPDSWADEAMVRERAASIDRELDQLTAEIPSRRRGRRGGRHRSEGSREGTAAAGQSGIMAGSDEGHEQDQTPPNPADAGGDAGIGPADPEAGFPVDN